MESEGLDHLTRYILMRNSSRLLTCIFTSISHAFRRTPGLHNLLLPREALVTNCKFVED